MEMEMKMKTKTKMKWYLSVSRVTKWKAIRSALPLPRPQFLQLSVHRRSSPVSINSGIYV